MKRTKGPRLLLSPSALWLTMWAVATLGIAVVDSISNAQPLDTDFLEPEILTSTMYSRAAEPKELLFRFRRTASRSNSIVNVVRDYYFPNGSLAARERVVYEAGRLVAHQLEEVQTGAAGSAVVRPDPPGFEGPNGLGIHQGPGGAGQKEERLQPLRKDTLINDMIAPFVLLHWDALMRGETVKSRFIALERAETIGFAPLFGMKQPATSRPSLVHLILRRRLALQRRGLEN
jgi:hypothetical protein